MTGTRGPCPRLRPPMAEPAGYRSGYREIPPAAKAYKSRLMVSSCDPLPPTISPFVPPRPTEWRATVARLARALSAGPLNDALALLSPPHQAAAREPGHALPRGAPLPQRSTAAIMRTAGPPPAPKTA